MKKTLKAILAGLIKTICIVVFFMVVYALAHFVKELGGGDGAMVLMIVGVIWICASMAFYETDDKI